MAKKKIRFNAIDAVLILFFVCAAVAFGYVFHSLKNDGTTTGEAVKLQYVLKVGDIKDMLLGNVEKGDEILNANNGKSIGTVIALSSAPTKLTGTNSATGNRVISEIEGRSDLYITVSAEAHLVNNMYLVNGVGIMVGAGVDFVTPGLYAAASVVGVETVE